jgi:hypothetical protein
MAVLVWLTIGPNRGLWAWQSNLSLIKWRVRNLYVSSLYVNIVKHCTSPPHTIRWTTKLTIIVFVQNPFFHLIQCALIKNRMNTSGCKYDTEWHDKILGSNSKCSFEQCVEFYVCETKLCCWLIVYQPVPKFWVSGQLIFLRSCPKKCPDFTSFRFVLGTQDPVYVAWSDSLLGFGPVVYRPTVWHWIFLCDVGAYVNRAHMTFTYL